MNVLFVLLIGVMVGMAAWWIVPGRGSGERLASIVLGTLGAFIGGYASRFLGVYAEERAANLLMSAAGAVALLLCYHLLARDRAST